MKALATNARGEVQWSPDSLKRYQQLKGMADANPEEFMGVNVIEEKFPNRAKLELINLQQKKKMKAEADPRVNRAMGILRPTLIAAGVDPLRDREGYYQFVGAMQDALDVFQQEHKKSPDHKQVQEIGARILQEQVDPNKWSFGVLTRKTPLFQLTVPDEVAEKIKADPKWKELGVEPTDEQIRRVYVRKRYQELYGGEAKTPSVPSSK